MSRKMKIILTVLGVSVASVAAGFSLYFLRSDRTPAPSESAPTEVAPTESPKNVPTDTSPGEAETIEEFDARVSGELCGRPSISGRASLGEGKSYVVSQSTAERGMQAYYDDYLFCTMFLNEEGRPAEPFVEDAGDDFSKEAFDRGLYAFFSSLNGMFRAGDCASPEVDVMASRFKSSVLSPEEGSVPSDLENDLGGFEENLRNVSSADLCGLFTGNTDAVNRLRSVDFCAGNLDCQALMDDDIDQCDRIDTGVADDSASCRDVIRYRRAVRSGDASMCSLVQDPHRNIACQAYFFGEYPDMCDGLANGFSDKFCR